MNTKAASERYQRQLLDLVKQPGNDVCADCRGRAPRWASWNLGIFVCVQCAGVHRKMGTHISKIKSLTLDTWTREHVERMKEMGNIKSNEKWNPDERRNRPPANVDEGERNSELERFIFDKYKGKFMEKKPPPVPQKDASSSSLRLPPSPNPARSSGVAYGESRRRLPEALSDSDPISRSKTAPIPASWAEARARAASVSPAPPAPRLPDRVASSSAAPTPAQASDVARPGPASASIPPRASSSLQVPVASSKTSQTTNATPSSSVFDDLLQLQQEPDSTPQPPLQMNPWAGMQAASQQVQSPMAMQPYQQQHQAPFSPAGNPWAHANGNLSLSPTNQHLGAGFPSPSYQPQQVAYRGLAMGGVIQQQQNRSTSLGSTAFTSNRPSPGILHNNPFSQQQQPMNVQMQQQTGVGTGMQSAMTGYSGGFGDVRQQQLQQQQLQQQQLQQQQQQMMMMGQQAFSPGAYNHNQQNNNQYGSYFG